MLWRTPIEPERPCHPDDHLRKPDALGSQGTYQPEPGQSTCVACPGGSLCPQRSISPIECGPGRVAVPGSSSCSACVAGEYQHASGAAGCMPCTEGNYCAEGAAAPLPCPAGTRMNATIAMTSAADCIDCDAGSFCPIGTEAQTPCSPGAFAEGAQSHSCEPCSAGEFQPGFGSTACVACTRGAYCGAGASSPSPCEAGTTSNASGLNSSSGCVGVEPGFWAPTGSALPLACPASGFYCPGREFDTESYGAKRALSEPQP